MRRYSPSFGLEIGLGDSFRDFTEYRLYDAGGMLSLQSGWRLRRLYLLRWLNLGYRRSILRRFLYISLGLLGRDLVALLRRILPPPPIKVPASTVIPGPLFSP